jgi:hypothetical protein
MANGLLLHVRRWWIGCKRQMFEGTAGLCNVDGVWDGERDGGGATVPTLAWVTLSDGPNIGTLGSGVVGSCGCSTLGDGVSVAIGFVVPWRKIGRRISRSF